MSERVPDASHLPFKMGQEVICREGSVRREWGRDEKGGEDGEEFMGVEFIPQCTYSPHQSLAPCEFLLLYTYFLISLYLL